MIRNILRSVIAAAVITVGAAGGAQASYFSTAPNPLPNGSGFDLNSPSGICVTATECTHDLFISNLQFASATMLSNGEDEKLTATFMASFANPVTGVPTGTATLMLVSGTYFDVSILGGYNPFTNPTGTFPEVLNSASFTGTDSNGNAITASLLTAPPTTGTVTIASAPGGFNISSQFTVNAQSTVNGTPIAVPPLAATGTAPGAVPEPASLALLGMGLIGLTFLVRRRGASAPRSRGMSCSAA